VTESKQNIPVRFYGGAGNYTESLREMLDHLVDDEVTEVELLEWMKRNTRATSDDGIRRRLRFVERLGVVERVDERYRVTVLGERYLETERPELLYQMLSEAVYGFDTMLRVLADGPKTDAELADALKAAHTEFDWNSDDGAAQHRGWVQSLGYVCRTDGMNELTTAGREVVGILDELSDGELDLGELYTEAEREVTTTLDEEPPLIEETEEFTAVQNRVRSSVFSGDVRQAYGFRCAVCGSKREAPDGDTEVEAAHVYPRKYNGTDHVRNGLSLCRFHHWAFDHGWIAVTDDYRLLVADEPDLAGYDELAPLRGEEVTLPVDEKNRPATKFLAAHRALHGF